MSTFRRATGRRSGAVVPALAVVVVVLLLRSHLSILHAQTSASILGSDALRMRSDMPRLTAEVWAGYTPPELKNSSQAVAELLSHRELKDLEDLCGRCLADALHMVLAWDAGHQVLMATGDIPFMWIRDSAVQWGALLPRMVHQPALRLLVEGAVRTQAFMILQDPYANSYSLRWRKASELNKDERLLGRGGWVATRNYELDSGAYFINFLWNLFSFTEGYGRSMVLLEPVVFEAVSLLVDVWTTELWHEARSPYRYSELPREGRGPASNYTGMSWSAYRPSDDPNKYGFNLPANMYAHAALERALALNILWKNSDFEKRASFLADAIQTGIDKWGVATVDGTQVYVYEADGLGGVLVDFDDANVPSLLSIPLLGYKYDRKIYANTRQRILSAKNPNFFSGQHFKGIGSPHTPANYVWPMALIVQGLTSTAAQERADMLRTLLKLQCGNGLMHESVNVDNLQACTRSWFGWANSLLISFVESATPIDCTAAAEIQRLNSVKAREAKDTSVKPTNGDVDNPLYYEVSTADVTFDRAKLDSPVFHQQQ